MKQHGKKSAAALAVAVVNFAVVKAEPPEGMPERQAQIWREIVRGQPAEFFNTSTTKAMLGDLCRHKATADEISDLIDKFDPAWLAEAKGMRRYEWLLKIRRVETKAALDLATKLRLTNQSRWQPAGAATAAAVTEEEAKDDASPWMQAGKRSA